MFRERQTRLAQQALAHADTLHNFARHLTGSSSEAEDLVQETYARALGAAGGFREGTNLKAWLFRILRNVFLDQKRRPAPPPEAPGQDEDDPEHAFLGRVLAADLEAAMRALSEDARAVILLDLEGLSDAEIARVLGCAEGTVKSRLSRARAALRRELRR